MAPHADVVDYLEDSLLMLGKVKSWVLGKLVGGQVMKLLRMEFLKGKRTKIIAGGTILTNLGAIVAHLASVMGGEALNWGLLQSSGMQIVVAFGLITAAEHQPE